MDGNRRYAKENLISFDEAYINGVASLANFIEWSKEYGFTDVVSFAFSEDNWNRKEGDIESLFESVKSRKNEKIENFLRGDVRIRFIGNRSKFPEDIQSAIEEIERKTKHIIGINVWICISYSSRYDIIRVINEKIKEGREITQEEFSKALSTSEFPNPECIIRTGGVKRLSGFLLWEAEYSELYFIDVLWPNLKKEHFVKCMENHKARSVNRGR